MHSIFKNKNIVVTGHTGFKGSWLSIWLNMLSAKVFGLSNDVPTSPSHYELHKNVFYKDLRFDIRNLDDIKNCLVEIKPDFIFHLAAQPIVIKSYEDPKETFETNTMGSLNILEALKLLNNKCVGVFITSDKCYENLEWQYGYRENDILGGKDPYSASKAATEIILNCYYNSFFKNSKNVRLGRARAGNVIGGGDWTQSRIIPDCIKAWSKNKIVNLRNPNSTRPWQHVLEPLSGYLKLARDLYFNKNFNGEAFNFGPQFSNDFSVKELVEQMKIYWPSGKIKIPPSSKSDFNFYEAGLLKLNIDKAISELFWHPTLSFEETAKWTSEWYKSYYDDSSEKAKHTTISQIEDYMKLAASRKSFSLK